MSPLPSDTPRLPKWPFLIADVLLLGTAAMIASRNPAPYSSGLVAAITICVVLGCILGAIPFLSDYAQRQDEALDERQRGLEALTRTIADSAEQISVAANSMHETLELTRRQINQFESMPDTLGDSFGELNQQITGTLNAATETLQKEIKSLKAASEHRKTVDHTPEKLQLLHTRLEALEAKLSAQLTALALSIPPPPPAVVVPPSVDTAPMLPKAKSIESVPAPSIVEVPKPIVEVPEKPPQDPPPAPAEPTPAPILEATAPKPEKKPPPQKKPKPDDAHELPFAESTPPPQFAATVEKPAPTATTDNSTRLLVTAYIGIGNRLFVRGTGPGLSPGKGVPLQFVSIGKWQWESKEATAPLHVKLFKNDSIECTGLGEITLEPGKQLEVSATF